MALDLGNVLLSDATQTAFATLEQRFEIPAHASSAIWQSELRTPAELGELSGDDIWRRLASLASGVDKKDVADTFLAEFRPLPYGVATLKTAVDQGWRVGLATNHLSEWIYTWRSRYPWFRLLDPVVCSAEIRQRKPDVAFFEILIERMGTRDFLFVDDDLTNIEAARALGLTSVHAPVGSAWAPFPVEDRQRGEASHDRA